MIDSKDVAASWLRGLAARGVRVTVRNNRIAIHPKRAYSALSDDELITLRHCRAEIKECIRSGDVPLDVQPTEITAQVETKVPEPCAFCYQTPCIGDQHPAFLALHPRERQTAIDTDLTKQLLEYRR